MRFDVSSTGGSNKYQPFAPSPASTPNGAMSEVTEIKNASPIRRMSTSVGMAAASLADPKLWAVCSQESAAWVEHALLDDLVGSQQERRWDCESKCLRRLHVDHELELSRLLDGEMSGLRALENPVNVAGRAIEEISGVGSIRHEAAFF